MIKFTQKYEVPPIGAKAEYLPGCEGEVVGYQVVMKNPGFPSNLFPIDPSSETYYNSNLDKTLPLPKLDSSYGSLWWIVPNLSH